MKIEEGVKAIFIERVVAGSLVLEEFCSICLWLRICYASFYNEKG